MNLDDLAEAMCVRTWGHDEDGIPCSACRKEAALIIGRFELPHSWKKLPPEPPAEVTRVRGVKSGTHYVRDDVFPGMWRQEGFPHRQYFGFVLTREGEVVAASPLSEEKGE